MAVCSYLRACSGFWLNELDIGIAFCDVIITFLDNSRMSAVYIRKGSAFYQS